MLQGTQAETYQKFVEMFENDNFRNDKSRYIRSAISKELDITHLSNPELDRLQIKYIYMGLLRGFDVAVYASEKFDWRQMKEIYDGLVDGVDISFFAYPQMYFLKMRQIREALKMGYNVTEWAHTKYTDVQMLLIRRALDCGVFHRVLLNKMSERKANTLFMLLSVGFDINTNDHLSMITLKLQQIYYGVLDNVDVSKFAYPKYNSEQMFELRSGLKSGVDISKYSDENLTWVTMNNIREKIELEMKY